jgi:hypothetical protein
MATLTTGGAAARGGVVSTATLHKVQSFIAHIVVSGSLWK